MLKIIPIILAGLILASPATADTIYLITTDTAGHQIPISVSVSPTPAPPGSTVQGIEVTNPSTIYITFLPDTDQDGRTGLADAIAALQIVAGIGGAR